MKNSISSIDPNKHHVYLLILFLFTTLLFMGFGYSTENTTLTGSPLEFYISNSNQEGAFILSHNNLGAPIWIDSTDFNGVKHIAKLLQKDILSVTNQKPVLIHHMPSQTKNIIIVGTLHHSSIIDQLIKEKDLDYTSIDGKWDAYQLSLVSNPFPGIDKALVITGSNKRGTIYGMFELSAAIGVSPWYWWADVEPEKKNSIYIKPFAPIKESPKVKYRGIFINDEAPALSGWVAQNFGDFNASFYEHVFELILRLKGNFLWPAMWGHAFYDDDPKNAELADEMGLVIGTSHHEPMMRAHDEWRRYGSGLWNYAKNDQNLRAFWKHGIQRMNGNESIITLAMRGDGDEPMSKEANITLLENIVKDQRQIISEVTGKKPESFPQVWALYKEVQEYYDRGMRVPDDVTLLLCDDNWGNLRKLPLRGASARAGGYGIYYHFDYVGGPRNYKWINTNQISRVWEQMQLAYRHGVDRIWIVNVGDIKPMEYPISFFLDLAWDPERITVNNLSDYPRQWAATLFGSKYAKQIADILEDYSRFNSRRKPELLSPDTYSLQNFREAEQILVNYRRLEQKARKISIYIPDYLKDAYYQLVMHPVEASANLNALYIAAAKNKLYASQKRAATNLYADSVKIFFDRDAAITNYYNHELSDGKWNHFMDQTHIGYTYWQQPDSNYIPQTIKLDLPQNAKFAVAVEGSSSYWPNDTARAVLREFDSYNKQNYYIEIFNQGNQPFRYKIRASQPWIRFSEEGGTIDLQKRIFIDIDWMKLPEGNNKAEFLVTDETNRTVRIGVSASQATKPGLHKVHGFVENNGIISMEAPNFTRSFPNADAVWQTIPNIGRTLGGITPFPMNSTNLIPGQNSPRIEFDFFMSATDSAKIYFYLSPTLNFYNDEGLEFAFSLDESSPKTVYLHHNKSHKDWEQWVSNNISVLSHDIAIASGGQHILKIWMISPGVVIQKIVIARHNLPQSYLGPPQSVQID